MMPRETQVDPASSTINNGSFHDSERSLQASDHDGAAVVARRHGDSLWSRGINPDEVSTEAQHREKLESMQGGRVAPATTKVLALADGDRGAASSSSGRFPDELLSLSPPTSSVFSLSPTSNSCKIPTSLSPGAVAQNRSNHSSRPLSAGIISEGRVSDDGVRMMVGDGTGPHYQSYHPPQHSKIDPKLLLQQRQRMPLRLASDTLLQLVELSSLSDDDRSHEHAAPPARARDVSIKETAPTTLIIGKKSHHRDLVNLDNGTNTAPVGLRKQATHQYPSASFTGNSEQADTDTAITGTEHSYAAFDPALSTSTSFAKEGATTIHYSDGAYKTEREARPLYHAGESNHAAVTDPSTKEERPSPVEQTNKGAAFRRPSSNMTTRRAARQLDSKMDQDDNAKSSSDGKVLPTIMKDQDNDDGSSVDIGARLQETTTMNVASSDSRNPANTTTSQNVDQWNTRLQELQEYKSQYGHCNVPFCYIDKPFLAAWVKRQRYQYKCKMRGKHSHLTDEREALLEQLGFVWDTHVAAWEENYALMVEFYRQHGHCYVPIKQKELSTWAKRQRRHYKQYMQFPEVSSTTMTADRIRRLNEIDFPWTTTMRPNTKGGAVKGSSSGNSSFATTREEFVSAPSTNDNNITAEHQSPSTALGERIQDMAARTSSAPVSETSTIVTRARGVRRGGRSPGNGKKIEESHSK